MSVVGIDHVQMAIPPGSEERCRVFYVDVIGFTEVEKPKALKARGGLWLVGGAHRVHLGVEKDFRPARKAHPAFAVNDVEALAARMEAAGYEVTWSDGVPGRWRFHAFDPLGNRLEFIDRGPTGREVDVGDLDA